MGGGDAVRILSWLTLVLLVVVLVAGAGVTYQEGRTILENTRLIKENQAIIDSLKIELVRIEVRGEKAGEEVEALPDSLKHRGLQMSVRASERITKEMNIVGNQLMGYERRNRAHDRERGEASKRFISRNLPLGVTFILLGIVHLYARKRSRSQ
jgi:hypothetical protein